MLKPRVLRRGDTVMAVSLSWGGPAAIPHRYEAGKRQFEQEFGLRVVESRHALRDAAWLAANPRARADDLMGAFADPAVAAIGSTIGGDDSIRLLPFVDLDVIRSHPKIFLGFSDSTVTHMMCHQAGVTSFYGPSFMKGFAENTGILPYTADSVRKTLFSTAAPGLLEASADGWTDEFLDWADPSNQRRRRQLQPPMPWRLLQGCGIARGPLIGGCLEVWQWLRGTALWPDDRCFDGAILFLETSEEGASPKMVARELRVHAAMGLLARLSAILFARPGGRVAPERFSSYDQAILAVVRDEQGLRDLPIVTRMDFGHTDPMLVLPYGVTAEVNCDAHSLSILESGVTE
jgi:muramoyltetrapeptide carboxypeptidase LdcA involved in peptidoglycan recycling